MKTILITGISGFLGRNIFINYRNKYKFIGICNSEKKMSFLIDNYKDLILYKKNIASENFLVELENIFLNHKIDYVIHCAAMKHIDICENNKLLCLKTNIFATDSIIKISKKYNVSNMIAISTDKTINPTTTYGMSKLIMERLVLENGYSVFRGVNFFGSDGSVLEKWLYNHLKGEPINITNLEHERYYNDILYIGNEIMENLNIKNKVFEPKHILKIKLKVLYEAFKKIFPNVQVNVIGNRKFEKIIEEVNLKGVEIKELNIDNVLDLFKKHLPLERITTNIKIMYN